MKNPTTKSFVFTLALGLLCLIPVYPLSAGPIGNLFRSKTMLPQRKIDIPISRTHSLVIEASACSPFGDTGVRPDGRTYTTETRVCPLSLPEGAQVRQITVNNRTPDDPRSLSVIDLPSSQSTVRLYREELSCTSSNNAIYATGGAYEAVPGTYPCAEIGARFFINVFSTIDSASTDTGDLVGSPLGGGRGRNAYFPTFRTLQVEYEMP